MEFDTSKMQGAFFFLVNDTVRALKSYHIMEKKKSSYFDRLNARLEYQSDVGVYNLLSKEPLSGVRTPTNNNTNWY